MPPSRAARGVPLLALAYAGFISLGLPDGLLGVGWPSMRLDFGQPAGAVGYLLAAGTVGYMASSVAAGFVLARLGVGRLLAISTGMAALALIGYALSPVLATVVGCALLLGLGSGAIDSGLNAYAAEHFGARHMNWLHASFGAGATLGPLVMTGVLSAGLAWRWGYGLVAAAQALLATAFALTAGAWAAHRRVAAAPLGESVAAAPVGGSVAVAPVGGSAPAESVAAAPLGGSVSAAPLGETVAAALVGGSAPAGSAPAGSAPAESAPAGSASARPPVRRTLAVPAVWFGAAMFLCYVGLEVGAGLWAYTLLTEGRGANARVAGLCVSAYWGSLFVGRIVIGLLGDRVAPRHTLAACLALLMAGAALVALPAAWVAVLGLIVIGFAAAPIFPLLTLTTADRVGPEHADRAIGVQIGAAGLGGAVLPTGIGLALERWGAGALGLALFAIGVAVIVFYLLATASRGAGRRPAAAA
ncbi:MFS transporter [Rhizomonospora bruguierae]|uniref:MFS transporter n=1 Tax=Rhizomonospora bruguierae TaxID=1581705 RepID=UPI001BCB21E3|nr:MFS transporter [Micromonospora sp. NBRC 107566]